MAGNALKGTQDRPLFRDILPNIGHWPAIGQQNKGDNHILLLFVHFSLSDFAAKNLLHNFTLIHIGRCQNANDGLTENFFFGKSGCSALAQPRPSSSCHAISACHHQPCSFSVAPSFQFSFYIFGLVSLLIMSVVWHLLEFFAPVYTCLVFFFFGTFGTYWPID